MTVTATTDAPTQTVDELTRLYRLMATITRCETATVGAVRAGRLNAAVYPVRGLEAVCAAIGLTLEPTDYMVSTYRNLGDAIAKGVSIREVVAESYGRLGGTSKGLGGPMHLADVRHGLMATSGIVGGGVPIAVGLAVAAQLSDEDQVVLTTFGDGATSIGATHESMNLAALWKLPLVLVCQNNQWGEHTALAEYAGNPDLAERAASYGMRSEQVDGFDPVATLDAIRRAVDDARSGRGPVFIEAMTYRLGGHSAASGYDYMPKDEFAEQMKRDPTPAFREWLLGNGILDESTLEALDNAVQATVDDAMTFAADSPPPPQEMLYDDVYGDRSTIPAGTATWRTS